MEVQAVRALSTREAESEFGEGGSPRGGCEDAGKERLPDVGVLTSVSGSQIIPAVAIFNARVVSYGHAERDSVEARAVPESEREALTNIVSCKKGCRLDNGQSELHEDESWGGGPLAGLAVVNGTVCRRRLISSTSMDRPCDARNVLMHFMTPLLGL